MWLQNLPVKKYYYGIFLLAVHSVKILWHVLPRIISPFPSCSIPDCISVFLSFHKSFTTISWQMQIPSICRFQFVPNFASYGFNISWGKKSVNISKYIFMFNEATGNLFGLWLCLVTHSSLNNKFSKTCHKSVTEYIRQGYVLTCLLSSFTFHLSIQALVVSYTFCLWKFCWDDTHFLCYC
jgi:hypothetical protein